MYPVKHNTNGSSSASYLNFSRFTFQIDSNSTLGKIRDAVCSAANTAWTTIKNFWNWAWTRETSLSGSSRSCPQDQENGTESAVVSLANLFPGVSSSEGDLSGHGSPIKQMDETANNSSVRRQISSLLSEESDDAVLGEIYPNTSYSQENNLLIRTTEIAVVAVSVIHTDIFMGDLEASEGESKVQKSPVQKAPSEMDFGVGDSFEETTFVPADNTPARSRTEEIFDTTTVDNTVGSTTAVSSGKNSPNKVKSALPALFPAVSQETIAVDPNNPLSGYAFTGSTQL